MSRRITASRDARRLTELALGVPAVVATRTAMLAVPGAAHSARARREAVRMVVEKPLAGAEAGLAMMQQALRMQQQLFVAALQAWSRAWWTPWPWPMPGATRPRRLTPPGFGTWAGIGAGIARAGLKPVHRRVRGNVRRLRSRRK